jgi:hypothetical protein
MLDKSLSNVSEGNDDDLFQLSTGLLLQVLHIVDFVLHLVLTRCSRICQKTDWFAKDHKSDCTSHVTVILYSDLKYPNPPRRMSRLFPSDISVAYVKKCAMETLHNKWSIPADQEELWYLSFKRRRGCCRGA